MRGGLEEALALLEAAQRALVAAGASVAAADVGVAIRRLAQYSR